MTDLIFEPATALRALLVERRISARELLAAHLAQIERVNPSVNAIVTMVPERAIAAAEAADEALLGGAEPGILHGLPVAHKDLHDTAGIRTTYGSPLFADHVPTRSSLIVERMWRAGAVPLGKTNTPEFGAGSQTYNPVFGATANPYDLALTCGGSSGGAAAALASGMIALGDGSDHGASLRNPAAFCNVAGFRPTPGRVPTWPTLHAWWTGSVHGPMARTVDDVALFLSAIAGPDPRIPVSIDEPGAVFLPPLRPASRGTRIAWSSDLGGLPVDPAITTALDPHRATFAAIGFSVDEAEPDLDGFEEAFLTWRYWRTASDLGDHVRHHRDLVKPEIVWTAEQGFALSAADLGKADTVRSRLFERAAAFFEQYDYLVCPVTQVPPFSIDRHWVEEINGVPMEHFLAWIRSCYAISVIESPAISMPAGFTSDGLPVGIQIVGRRGDDLGVLRVAKAFEEATELWKRRPDL
jgi:amidase